MGEGGGRVGAEGRRRDRGSTRSNKIQSLTRRDESVQRLALSSQQDPAGPSRMRAANQTSPVGLRRYGRVRLGADGQDERLLDRTWQAA